MKYAINAPTIPEPEGPWSMGTTAGRLVFTAGQLPFSPENPNTVVPGGIRAQTDRVITVCETVLADAGCTLADVAKVTVYLTDINDLDAMDEVFGQRFFAPEPARSLVEVSALPMGALIEMDCVACR